MSIFEHNGKYYEYDDKLWKLVELSEEDTLDWDFPYTIKYVGPIVNGQIVGSVPKFPVLIGTFDNLTDLVELPTGLPRIGLMPSFKGCYNFNPKVEDLYAWSNKLGSGSISKNPFKQCGSKYLIDIGQQNRTAVEWLSAVFNIGTGVIYDKLVKFYGQLMADKAQSLIVTPYQIFCSMQPKQFLELVELFDVGVIDHIKFTTGGVIQFANVRKSSEITERIFAAIGRHIIACDSNPIRFCDDGLVKCYRIPKAFVIDTSDHVLISTYGKVLNNETVNCSYHAGKDGVIESHGNSTIISDDCVISGSGSLTIKGDGTLTLKCTSDMQPCIGIHTHTGMSYGRWCPGSDSPINYITVDGVKVICESSVPNFSIGAYGTDQMPEIHCINGGSLICPETKGRRLMTRSGDEDLCGSTKRVECAIYKIQPRKKYANIELYKQKYHISNEAFLADLNRLFTILGVDNISDLNESIISIL